MDKFLRLWTKYEAVPISVCLLDYTCRARWPEGLLCRRASNVWRHRRQIESTYRLVQILVSPGCSFFLTHFYFHRNQITLSICGDTSFLPSFLRSIVLFKAISWVQKVVKTERDGRTDARTHGQTHINNLRPPAQKPFGQLSSELYTSTVQQYLVLSLIDFGNVSVVLGNAALQN